ncbi:YjhX family toxin [Mesorhizobium silamurunense]|uniref:YjhX family toxin n=1 Tax=Mesorhizobium silamurunense TaxID=499528 RepID=UPI0017855850|nr:YjhX family toxin [Mesorhizobium silamurunense]
MRVQEDARRYGEQRILHLLAQGGRIEIEKSDARKIALVRCLTRDGWHYPGLDLDLFRKLKRKKAVSSASGGPYRITRHGLELVRAELDNR